MKTDRLEEFIKNNREDFDYLEPSPEVWNRIAENTKKTRKLRPNAYLIRVAAVVAILLASSALLLKTSLFPPGKYTLKTDDPELMELMEAEAFYAHLVDERMAEIRKCYYTFPELKDDIETDLNELEEMYNVLKSDLKENISSKTVIEAMIENNRNRLQLVDDVLEQIKC